MPYISGFRKGYDCQIALIRFTESVKRYLDNGEAAGALVTDLSKAFDCLPHDLLVPKMYAYGLSQTSCYVKDRWHRVKIGVVRNDWKRLRKGTLQGSVMGPMRTMLTGKT